MGATAGRPAVSCIGADALYPNDDGRKMMLVLPTEDDDIRGTTGAVFVVDLDTGKLEQRTPNRLTVHGAAWLPSGEGIIFSAAKNNKKNRERLFKGKMVQFDLYRLLGASESPELVIRDVAAPSISKGRPGPRIMTPR